MDYHRLPEFGQAVKFSTLSQEDYHWHIELIPRLIKMAGFKWGSGFCINPTPLEVVAQIRQETEVDI